MKNQLKIIPIIILFLLNNNLFAQKKNLPVFTAQVEGWHKADSVSHLYINDSTYLDMTRDTLYVNTFIKNNSADTLSYIIWTCAWEQFYIIDSKNLTLPGIVCTKNGLVIRKILPYEFAERLVPLLARRDTKPDKFRVGFELYQLSNSIKDMERADPWKYYTPKNKIILWSNTLELK